LRDLESSLDVNGSSKLAKMKRGKTPQAVREMLGGDLNTARERVRAGALDQEKRAATAAQSKERVEDLRQQIMNRGLMRDQDVRSIINGTTSLNRSERVSMLRDKFVAKILRGEAERVHPGAEVFDGVKIYERVSPVAGAESHIEDPGPDSAGLTIRDGKPYMQRGEIDMMIVERQPSGRAKIVSREEIKTGARDTNADARRQLNEQTKLFRDAASGGTGQRAILLEFNGKDITDDIDMVSDALATKTTRGPAGKAFDNSLGVSASDLEALCKELLFEGLGTGKGIP
jgi:hypothetical protein